MDLYRDAVLGAYRALTDANVAVQVVHEDQIAASPALEVKVLD